MTDTLSPLTSAELADLKLRAKHGEIYIKKTILRLIHMIERRDERIEKLENSYRCYSCKQWFEEDNGHGLARQHFGAAYRDPLPICCDVIDGKANWGGGEHDPFVRVRKSYFLDLEKRVEALAATEPPK